MNRRRAHHKAVIGVALMLAAGILCAGGTALACGYHSPSDIARGVMNLVYPKSLYVRTAVWQAQSSGLLPPRPRRAAKDMFAYQRTTLGLEELGRSLGPAPDPGFAFTIILLDSMLWTRYAAEDGGFGVSVHATGPEQGDVVLVTERAVVRALNAGSISFDVAEAEGLIRLYGPEKRQEALRDVMRGEPRDAQSDLPDRATEASG
ncbi:hypothetical protein [Methyloceanibacter sp. wino2]|uniref:hypothetical protein n=1 Tax=Methyloceanibacter sp. wino2 TaxID=2170729 RepID=UPI000D3E1550|nr:hypothetical protein [Methyloceanibacter sp. wino2]